MKIEQWLRGLGLDRYTDTFVDNDVDLRTLPHLTESDLRELGVSLGHRRLLLAEITRLAAADAPHAPTAESDPMLTQGEEVQDTPRPAHVLRGDAERRQLAVFFCDLVGSTEITHRFDPEDMRDVLRRYQYAVTAAVQRFEGHVARFVGDGVLAYFGWPRAFEDQAERAVRAALGAVSSVATLRLPSGEYLQARIGIETGEVVVGDLVGELASDRESVTGDTPNLAARLQSLATPGQIVIGPGTQRLIGPLFELEPMGAQVVKGFSQQMQAWIVVGEHDHESRYVAAKGRVFTRHVGREHELGMLHDRWELAKGGEGQVIMLSGEAGIGKSRMVQQAQDELGVETRFSLSAQCSPYHTSTAFYPVVQRLRHAAGFAPEDSPSERLDKLEKLLVDTREDVATTAPLFAELLDLPGEERYGPLDPVPTTTALSNYRSTGQPDAEPQPAMARIQCA